MQNCIREVYLLQQNIPFMSYRAQYINIETKSKIVENKRKQTQFRTPEHDMIKEHKKKRTIYKLFTNCLHTPEPSGTYVWNK